MSNDQNIVRTDKSKDPYTRVSNRAINDKNLTEGPLAILLYLLSKPDNWEYRAKDIQRRFSMGRDKLHRCMKELKDLGYVTQVTTSGGHKAIKLVTLFYEAPDLNPEFLGDAKHGSVKPTPLVITEKESNNKEIFVEIEPEPEKPKCSLCHKALVEEEGNLCAVCAMVNDILLLWGKLFPKKSQPRPATYRKQIKTRMKSPDFRESWSRSLQRAAKSRHLHESGWFRLEYFLRNDENWRKIYDGAFDRFGEKNGYSNGHGGVADSAWAEVSKVVAKQGRYSRPLFDDKKIAKAVEVMGWNNICDLPDGEGKKMFGEIYSGIVRRDSLDDKLGNTW